MANINLYNVDCMSYMKGIPDKAYDLAIVDPEYGIGLSKREFLGGGKLGSSFARQKNGTRLSVKNKAYPIKQWDNKRPAKEYFTELQRVSTSQIIFGGNYFADMLPASAGWIYWHKEQSGNYSDGELMWTSFDCALRSVTVRWNGMIQYDMANKEKRIHQAQKPIPLYKWLLENYAKPGDKILDTHGGSMSIAIACYDLGFDLDACELDPDYFKDAKGRYETHVAKYAPAHEIPITKNGEIKLF